MFEFSCSNLFFFSQTIASIIAFHFADIDASSVEHKAWDGKVPKEVIKFALREEMFRQGFAR